MKRLTLCSSLLVTAIAIPTGIVLAQTPTTPTPTPTPATTTTTGSSIPYIPLIGASNGTTAAGGVGGTVAWFIDVASKRVVRCSETGTAGGGGNQAFTCTAQPIP
jgi:hypothetical protein